MSERRPAGPIPTSRLLVGILLHFCIPAYLLLSLATSLLVEPPVTAPDQIAGRMLWTAAWFAPAFLILSGFAAAVGAMVDRRRPRNPDAAEASRIDLTEGARLLAGLPDARLARALARVEAAGWDHDDARYQRVAGDLRAAGRTFATASSSATPDRRAAVLELAADSVERLAAALAGLDDQQRRLDEGDARTIAGFIGARYPD